MNFLQPQMWILRQLYTLFGIGNWGIVQGLTPFFILTFFAQLQEVDDVMERMLGNQYYRFQPQHDLNDLAVGTYCTGDKRILQQLRDAGDATVHNNPRFHEVVELLTNRVVSRFEKQAAPASQNEL